VHEIVELNALIQNMLNLVKHSAKANQIAIHFEPADVELCVRANRNEIKQVLLNLLKNSFEAMTSGGEITIHTSQVYEGDAPSQDEASSRDETSSKDEASSRDDGALAQITFTDTGPGICDENPDNIFLPFYSTKKGAEQNLGLGLSVSYGIIKKYHGTISVQNVEQAGCQFCITLPLTA
jgi:signal transduction histidine kinase